MTTTQLLTTLVVLLIGKDIVVAIRDYLGKRARKTALKSFLDTLDAKCEDGNCEECAKK